MRTLIFTLFLLLAAALVSGCASEGSTVNGSTEQGPRFVVTRSDPGNHAGGVSSIDVIRDTQTGYCVAAIRFYSGGGAITSTQCDK